MALDVYVGSLTRYYARDWQTAGERAAAASGVPHRTVFADGVGESVTDPDEIRAAVLEWREQIAEALGQPHGWDWSERGDEPWASERPAWDGWSALVLHAAYTEHPGLERPAAVSEDSMDRDEAWRRVRDAGEPSRFRALYHAELWLPVEGEALFEAEDVAGNRIGMTSVTALVGALEELNERTFQLSPGDVEHHRVNAEELDATFEAKARWGLGVFVWCARFAAEHRLPMKLDY